MNAPVHPITIFCQKCERPGAVRTEDEAEARRMLRFAGWRIYDGPSQTGKELHVIYCPVCAGLVAPEDQDDSYDAQCHTCQARMSEDYDPLDDDIITEADARRWANEHECEPDVDIIRPVMRVLDVVQSAV